MPKITIEVSDDEAAQLTELAQDCTNSDVDREGATTHGQLDIVKLLTMLAGDAALAISRPGSWEGAGMREILQRHGYHV